MKKILTICLFIITGAVQAAGTINCGVVSISALYVQGDRGDASFHANKMLILLGEGKLPACNDFSYAYLENTDAAYNGTLSMALAVFMSGKKIRIQVEDAPAQEGAKRIAWVNLNI